MTALKSQAIQTALVGDWHSAINWNNQILDTNPDDIDALNRLAFAHASLGEIKEAKSLYEKVLELDMQNPIASKNIKRLAVNKTIKPTTQLNNLFIEEPGKTKVIELLNLAEKKVISLLRSGEKINLTIKRNKIFAVDDTNQYIGMLSDDICQRLIKFMSDGNQYDAYIRTVENNRISIFVREIKRIKKFSNQPSFVSLEKTKLSIKHSRQVRLSK